MSYMFIYINKFINNLITHYLARKGGIKPIDDKSRFLSVSAKLNNAQHRETLFEHIKYDMLQS